MKLNRIVASARSRAEAASVVAGVRRIRPRYDVSFPKWDGEYASGALDHYGDLNQLSRYSVLVGYLERLSPARILDLGCGVGLLRQKIEHIDFEEFVGLDPSSVAIDAAQQLSDPRTSFRVGEVPDGEYDVVICNEMLYYVEDLDDLLARVEVTLGPTGHLVTSIYKHPGDFALHHLLNQRLKRIDGVDVRNTVSGHRWKLGCYAMPGRV